MERFIAVHVVAERVDRDLRLHHGIAALDEPVEITRVAETLRCETRSRAFEHAAEIDRIVHFGARECAHDETAVRSRIDEPDVRKTLERETNRCTGHAESIGERNLGNSIAPTEFAAEQ